MFTEFPKYFLHPTQEIETVINRGGILKGNFILDGIETNAGSKSELIRSGAFSPVLIEYFRVWKQQQQQYEMNKQRGQSQGANEPKGAEDKTALGSTKSYSRHMFTYLLIIQ